MEGLLSPFKKIFTKLYTPVLIAVNMVSVFFKAFKIRHLKTYNKQSTN